MIECRGRMSSWWEQRIGSGTENDKIIHASLARNFHQPHRWTDARQIPRNIKHSMRDSAPVFGVEVEIVDYVMDVNVGRSLASQAAGNQKVALIVRRHFLTQKVVKRAQRYVVLDGDLRVYERIVALSQVSKHVRLRVRFK